MAQFILESGYGKSELAQKANNCFGMKQSLSGNTWAGSAWDGKSVYTKKTQEQKPNGSYVTITADFRKYPSIQQSIADHSAYLVGAKDGSKWRYSGLKGCKDYREAFKIIKAGGYATSHDYVEKLCKVVEEWGLTKYDVGKADTRTYRAKSVVNIRSGPGTGYKIVGSLKKGEEVSTATRKKDDQGRTWGKINRGWFCLGKSGNWYVDRIK